MADSGGASAPLTSGWPFRRTPGARAVTSVAESPAPPLLGRDDDLRAVHRLLDRLVPPDGDPGPHREIGTLILVGEPGIGKTALLQTGIAQAADRGIVVLYGGGAESERHLPFAVLFDLLRPLLDDIDVLSPAHRDALSRA